MEDRHWSRIEVDVTATTGRILELHADVGPGSWIEIRVFLDGVAMGGFGRGYPSDPEAQLALCADLLREHSLDEAIWGGWPICPDHHTHPLDACIDSKGLASWCCPQGRVVARIGNLAGSVDP